MKKNIFFYLLAAFAAVSATACSSDDDESSSGNEPAPVNLPAPATAANAVQYNLTTALIPAETSSEIEEAPQLSYIEVTESSQILLELSNPIDNTNLYFTENVAVSDNVYTINSQRVKGTVKVIAAQTRAAYQTALEIDLAVKLENDVLVTYKTGNEGVVAFKEATPVATDDAMTRLCRTWNILGATLDLADLDKNEKYYMEFESKNNVFYLKDVLNEAKKRDVSFSVKDEEDLNREVSAITITSTGKLIITYTKGNDDVAEWRWSNAEKTAFTIKLKDGSEGNKFINDDTHMQVAFSDNRCNLMMSIKFDDDSDKNWDASLLLKLQSK